MPEKGPPKTACARVRELEEAHSPYWRGFEEARREEMDFLDGDRYAINRGPYNRDRRLLQITGQEIQDTIRHKVAEATSKARTVQAKAIDRVDDPDDGEIATALIELERDNPYKGFKRELYATIMAACQSRIGIMWMDWDPDEGPYGEILYGFERGQVMWDEAYHPHHPKCAWLIRKKRIDCDVARETYGKEWLTPDREAYSSDGSMRSGIPLSSMHDTPGSRRPDDNKVTLWECWYKNDKTKKYPDGPEPLKPEKQYMTCLGECGYRTPTQGEIARIEGVDEPMPEMLPRACPTCGGDLERIEMQDQDPTTLLYRKGRRMIATAPLCAAPDDRAAYDGKWPIPSARSFPALFITAYVDPGKPMGKSDTFLMWDQQVASDNLMTQAVQRSFEHRDYWAIPRVGVVDHNNQRWMARDDQHNIMFKDMTKARFGPLDIQHFAGTGLDPSWPITYQAVQGKLTAQRGVADFGFTPENSKNIAASTVAQLTQQGNIPTADFQRRINDELSMFEGVRWDYIRATYTHDRLTRLQIEGVDSLHELAGDDMPNYDFVIEETPDFTGLEKAKADAFEGMLGAYERAIGMGADPLIMVEAYAEVNDLPRSVLKKFQKMFEAMEEKRMMAEQEAADAIDQGADPFEMGIGGPGAEQGMNGAGEEPVAAA